MAAQRLQVPYMQLRADLILVTESVSLSSLHVTGIDFKPRIIDQSEISNHTTNVCVR